MSRTNAHQYWLISYYNQQIITTAIKIVCAWRSIAAIVAIKRDCITHSQGLGNLLGCICIVINWDQALQSQVLHNS
jgi:hypothetical protein